MTDTALKSFGRLSEDQRALRRKNVRVLILTAYDDDPYIFALLQAGGIDAPGGELFVDDVMHLLDLKVALCLNIHHLFLEFDFRITALEIIAV